MTNEPTGVETSHVHVLISHALATYASALSGLLRHVRPHLEVRVVPPDDLESELAKRPGAVVVSDVVSPVIRRHSGGWILYYPDQQNVAVAEVGGYQRTLENPSLEDVLFILDRATGIATIAQPADIYPNTQPA